MGYYIAAYLHVTSEAPYKLALAQCIEKTTTSDSIHDPPLSLAQASKYCPSNSPLFRTWGLFLLCRLKYLPTSPYALTIKYALPAPLQGSTAKISNVIISGCDVPPCRAQRGTNITVDVDFTSSEYLTSS